VPSASLLLWQSDRMPRLQQIDLQCAACLAAMPPNPHLIDENLRGYVVLLSAHFQGFCRDLCTEAAVVIASKVRPSLRILIREHFTANRQLDRGNPSLQNLKKDFERFDFTLDLTVDPANARRLMDLSALIEWRNVAAHQGTTVPAGIPLDLPSLRAWRASCDGLATSLDASCPIIESTKWTNLVSEATSIQDRLQEDSSESAKDFLDAPTARPGPCSPVCVWR
jgi:hypothetical protein